MIHDIRWRRFPVASIQSDEPGGLARADGMVWWLSNRLRSRGVEDADVLLLDGHQAFFLEAEKARETVSSFRPR